jgi:hypothetical protein
MGWAQGRPVRDFRIAGRMSDALSAASSGRALTAECAARFYAPGLGLLPGGLLGLGKAAVLEGIHRCGMLGAKQAYVISSQQFYYCIGFYPIENSSWWIYKNNRVQN